MEHDDLSSTHDAEWLAGQAPLDRALTAAIRAPAVDERFDERVRALIRAEEAKTLSLQSTWGTRLGTPWWLYALDLIAIAVTAVALMLALRSTPLAVIAPDASWFVEHAKGSGLFALLVAAIGVGFALWQSSARLSTWP